MSLEHTGYIPLPTHKGVGGFDHAAVHPVSGRMYVAHTANDAVDVIDGEKERYLESVPNLTRVAGALVSAERNLVFTSNRGENTVGIFAPGDEGNLVKVRVGVRPNGLAFDPMHGLLLAANVGDPAIPNSFTVSLVHVGLQRMLADVTVPGRTRWSVFDAVSNLFYVNIAAPPQIVAIDPSASDPVAAIIEIPCTGPHGLDLDTEARRLFCACDEGKLVVVELPSGKVSGICDLSGTPDVIFFNRERKRLYVAIGEPGVIDIFDTCALKRIEVVVTERGAHTLGFDLQRNKVYAFLPESHRVAVYVDVRVPV